MIPSPTRLLSLFVALLLSCNAFAQAEKPAPIEPVPAEEPQEEKETPAEPEPAPEKETAAAEVEPPKKTDPQDDGYKQVEILLHAIETIRQKYVDEDKVSYDRLMEAALEGMFSSLDPHSSYMHRRLFEQMQKSQSNSYDGIGITISFKDNLLRIVSVREDGPAARAGIFPGDEIIRIDNILADQVGITEALGMLRGKPGQPIKLVVRRSSTKEMLEMEIVREVMKESTIKDIMLLKPKLAGTNKIGYMRLLQFNRPTARELADALDELEDRGMQAFVLDLRNNPGGLLSSAVDVCGEFLPPNTTVLTTRGRVDSMNPPPYRTSEKQRRARTYPVAILINQTSASGAEVVAGALQDLKRAVIVGETSFGKGSVQSIIPMGMGTGAAMRLTTAKYYTPSQKVIHEEGVTPNIEITLTPAEERELARWRNRTNLGKEQQTELDHFRDRQLERAVDAMKGALVYQRKADQKKPATPKKKIRQPLGN
ncbi:MAG: carboxyl-terminal processing protease [Verrucomicrobiales bacterium]|jgi:carboxyl-terminal processing protease